MEIKIIINDDSIINILSKLLDVFKCTKENKTETVRDSTPDVNTTVDQPSPEPEASDKPESEPETETVPEETRSRVDKKKLPDPPAEIKMCNVCGSTFTPNKSSQVTCSKKCSFIYSRYCQYRSSYVSRNRADLIKAMNVWLEGWIERTIASGDISKIPEKLLEKYNNKKQKELSLLGVKPVISEPAVTKEKPCEHKEDIPETPHPKPKLKKKCILCEFSFETDDPNEKYCDQCRSLGKEKCEDLLNEKIEAEEGEKLKKKTSWKVCPKCGRNFSDPEDKFFFCPKCSNPGAK